MNKIILVEGKDDKAFIESMLDTVDVKVDEIEVNTEMGGLSYEGLSNALAVAKNKISKYGVTKIGVVIDLDDSSHEERLAFLNECINNVFGVSIDADTNHIDFAYEDLTITLSCHFINYENVGEIEGYLMKIASSNANYSNCLSEWRKCIGDGKISDKEFRKLWVHYYVRWDISNDDERKHGSKYCSLEYALKNKKEHWDFNSDALSTLKEYLASFKV